MDSDLRVLRTVEEVHAKSAGAFIRKVAVLSNFRARIHVGIASGIATSGWVNKLACLLEADPPELEAWAPVHLWCVDEAYVPKDDQVRVDRHLRSTLVDRFPTLFTLHSAGEPADGSLREVATAYGEDLVRVFSVTRPVDPRSISMDIVVLNIGPDGHFGALYPSHETLSRSGLVLPVPHCPGVPHERVTMSVPLLRRSRYAWFVAAGSKVAPALAHSLHGADFRELPAAAMNQVGTTWWSDSAAAARVALGVN